MKREDREEKNYDILRYTYEENLVDTGRYNKAYISEVYDGRDEFLDNEWRQYENEKEKIVKLVDMGNGRNWLAYTNKDNIMNIKIGSEYNIVDAKDLRDLLQMVNYKKMSLDWLSVVAQKRGKHILSGKWERCNMNIDFGDNMEVLDHNNLSVGV